MLISFILFVVGLVLQIVLAFLSLIFAFFPQIDYAFLAAGKVFGNIMLFDSFLPVTEAFILAFAALSVKFALAVFGAFMWLAYHAKGWVRYTITFRS